MCTDVLQWQTALKSRWNRSWLQLQRAKSYIELCGKNRLCKMLTRTEQMLWASLDVGNYFIGGGKNPESSGIIWQIFQKRCPRQGDSSLVALFNNMRTLKFKAKLTITFYAAVNHYRNGHPKAETSKMDRNPPITNLTCWPLWNTILVS